ncbi:MAG: SDR family NAD(P)-dependent oxidoreductase [Paracoccaceae bacterium]
MPALEQRTAIVTGGARGIGRGCAHALAAKGYAVALVDVLVPEMQNTQAEIEAMNVPCTIHEADVALYGRAHEVAASVLSSWGRIDVLVNNAGRPMPTGVLDLTEEQWDSTIDINLKSCFNYIQAVSPAMIERNYGRIVSMSSLNAHSGGVTAAVSKVAYAAAKAGIIGLTRALAKELGPHIAINCVCPGLIKTELTMKNPVIAAREPELIKGIGLNRCGTPADVAELVAFLATAEHMFITGQDITIDGFQWNR